MEADRIAPNPIKPQFRGSRIKQQDKGRVGTSPAPTGDGDARVGVGLVPALFLLLGGFYRRQRPGAFAPGRCFRAALQDYGTTLRHDFFGGQLAVHQALDAGDAVVFGQVDGPHALGTVV